MAQVPMTFGLPSEQADFVTRNAAFLEVLPRLTQRINEIVAQRTFARDPRGTAESEEDWQRRVIAQRPVFFLGRLAAEDFMEILLLCGNGYGMAGLKLLRSMFEGVITGIYIARHHEAADAFLGYHTICIGR